MQHLRTGLPARFAVATAAAFFFQAAPVQAATSILFIGNSFTYGALATAQDYIPGSVTDLRGTGIGGVPAIFKKLTVEAGLDYDVSLETQPGSNLDYHYDNQLALIDKPWDKVVMHGQSNLDFNAPNDPTKISTYTGLLGAVFKAQNPNVEISLTATWARADLTYANASSPWYGEPISAMAYDLQAGYEVAKANNPTVVDHINPVGLAWNRAMEIGIADPNPYDGVTPGQINLWAPENYHASNAGYYLHALVVFGMETGIDPRTLGGTEQAAFDLGLSASEAYALQVVAFDTISAVPEASTWLMMLMGGGLIGWLYRRKTAAEAA